MMNFFFSKDADLALRVYVEASFAIHTDGTSRTANEWLMFLGVRLCVLGLLSR